MAMDPAAVEEQWLDLVNGRVPPEESEPLVAEAVEELDTFIEAHPSARDDMLALMAKHLAGAVTDRTWPIVDNALRDLVGMRTAYLVAWLVVDDNPTPRMEETARVAPTRVMDLLRSILAFHFEGLARALALANGPPDDWRIVLREVNSEQVSGRMTIRLRVLKMNNDWAVIEGAPDSILNFGRQVLAALNAVGTAGAFSPRMTEMFLEEARPLVEMLETGDDLGEGAALEGLSVVPPRTTDGS